jgi:mobilome CxxCx(11)CxxC protein
MTLDDFKKHCIDHMFWCYGTSAIFQRREHKLKRLRELITYLGIVGPLIIGSAVGSFGKDWKIGAVEIVPIIVVVASSVGIFQIILSVWALVARWDEAYGAAQESVRANNALYNQFKSLHDRSPQNFMDALTDVQDENTRQEAQDYRQSITASEKRYAYHESMRYLRRACRVCNVIPTGKSSKCSECGMW